MAGLSTSIRMLSWKLQSVLESEFAIKHKKSASRLEMIYSKLTRNSSLIVDAEEMELEESVKNWLQKLEDVVYDADDLADEILYEETRRKLGADKPQKLASLARSLIPSFGERYSKVIKQFEEAIEAIDVQIPKAIDALKVSCSPVQKKDEEFQSYSTTSLIDVTEIVGRREEKRAIVRSLQAGDAKLDAIAIVGMGGCGKTTLAKLVYNDDIVRKHFELRAWISVSFDFDVRKITRAILEATTSHIPESYELELLQIELRKCLTEKRFLLVLDDVWNQDALKMELLRLPLKSGARGSKILITTRNADVAYMMGSSDIFHITLLSDDDCWSLFEMSVCVGMGESVPGELRMMGMEIVRKCRGLPLAAKAMGGLLRFKRSIAEWYEVLNRISLLSQDGPVWPILKLSYDYLPANLKPCFAYCSLFPSDYEFEKEKLVLLWMAEGFLLPSSHGQSMEQVGAEYFDGLLKRSLLVPVGGSHFRMHDLIHDLASFVSREVFLRLESNQSISKRTRHLSIAGNGTLEKFQVTCEATRLRTFLLFNSPSDEESFHLNPNALEDILKKQQRLRVLSLPQTQHTRLLNSVGQLKLLRQLDLSESALQSLPESVFTLYHLQTLILTNCRKLIMLPKGIIKLFNLRHLYIKGTSLQQMPGEIGRLHSLQTLTNFIVGDGLNIRELRTLVDLRGTLSISKLQNVLSASDALDVKLKDKRYLTELQLEWSSNEGDAMKYIAVLQTLEPSRELRKLTIQSYGGIEFPSWLGDSSFSCIVFLCLRDCNNCSSLPPLGQLPSLQDLIIEGVDGVSSIGHEFYRREDESISKPFPSLKTLTFDGMKQWEQWISLEDEEFPCLQKLYLMDCPKLNGGLPKSLPSLVELRISSCQQLAAFLPRTPDTCKKELYNCDKVRQRDDEEVSYFPSSIGENSTYQHEGFSEYSKLSEKVGKEAEGKKEDDSFSSSSSVTFKVSSIMKLQELPLGLSSLRIERCNALETLPGGVLDKPLLQRLYIIDCDSLKTFPQLQRVSSLRRLYIHSCRNLQFPQHNEMANKCNLLEHLCLGSSCDSLKSFLLNSFQNLKTLSLWDCKNLETLSMEKRLPHKLESLEVLEVRDCPNLATFPKEGFQAPKLTSLVLSNCSNLKSLPRGMQSLSCLQSLHINKCPELESLPSGGLPSSLNILCITLCDKITPQAAWGLNKLQSLSHFEIEGGCADLLSFPEEGLLPTNLQSLRITRLPNLKSLDEKGIQRLTSLQTLEVNGCNEMRSLPEDGLPSSLCLLNITDCSLLNPKLRKRKGKEWSKIAHIPSIYLGEERISSEEYLHNLINLDMLACVRI